VHTEICDQYIYLNPCLQERKQISPVIFWLASYRALSRSVTEDANKEHDLDGVISSQSTKRSELFDVL
jgi:hypothetical protein